MFCRLISKLLRAKGHGPTGRKTRAKTTRCGKRGTFLNSRITLGKRMKDGVFGYYSQGQG